MTINLSPGEVKEVLVCIVHEMLYAEYNGYKNKYHRKIAKKIAKQINVPYSALFIGKEQAHEQ